jgi:pyruvate kinase
MKRQRFTKIIATLGPASNSLETINELFIKGVDVFRLNFSHGSFEDHKRKAEMIREVSRRHNHPIAILQDLQGPKLRVGKLKEKVELVAGSEFSFDLDESPGSSKRAYLPHPEIFAVVKPGMHILIDDGKIRVKVTRTDDKKIDSIVMVGGFLSSHKGVNVPDVQLPISALTSKDLQDIEYGKQIGVDYVALSFVQNPDDIIALRSQLGGSAKIIAKLEKPAAIQHLSEIISQADAIMVARGDLGVEMNPEQVPRLQKQIIRESRKQSKPVIVATQMLESMINNPVPTRAEASDVASAVYDYVDAVMLSAESASGSHPIKSVEVMESIIKTVESDEYYLQRLQELESKTNTGDASPTQAISQATSVVASNIGARAIVVLTETGRAAIDAASRRPSTSLIALSPIDKTANQICLLWGAHPYLVERFSETTSLLKSVSHILTNDYEAVIGDHVVVTSGPVFMKSHGNFIFKSGSTRVLRVVTLGEDL